MSPILANILEEQWTPTTIRTAFVFHLPPRLSNKNGRPRRSRVYIDLPLQSLGWTFALSLKRVNAAWTPEAFSFRRHDSAIPWGSTTLHAQLSLAVEQPQSTDAQHADLGTMKVVLVDIPSLELPLTTSCIISSRQPNKVWLTVSISDCPLANGLFQARFSIKEAEVQVQLVRQSGDRLLSRSLTTGELFDVKFLTPSTRSTSGNPGEPLPTYASLSVLEEHVDLSSSVLREGWTNALAVLDNTSTKCVREVSCPDEYDYELDSDFDEDEPSFPPYNSSSERDKVASEDQQSESSTESSTSSFSSLELERASDQGLVGHRLEEVINVECLKEPPCDSDCERTVEIKFAAHRTWHAFLWYCYTGNLEFSKLKSQVGPGGRHLRATPLEGGPPACSPKSMYRLADLVGDKNLKAKALAAIKERMSEENVLDEAFSVFTSKYPEVREAQLGVLMEHCGSPKVKRAFLRAMGKYGSVPHMEPMLSAFYDNLVA